MTDERIADLVSDYEALKDAKAEIDEQAKALAARLEAAEDALIHCILDANEATGTDGKYTVGGRAYSVELKTYYRIPADRREEAFAAMRDTLNLADLIQERVDDRTLTKVLRGIQENNGGALPEEYDALGLATYDKTTLRSVKK